MAPLTRKSSAERKAEGKNILVFKIFFLPILLLALDNSIYIPLYFWKNFLAIYCAWKGQLFIQDQQISDIALRSSCRFSIPAQLPTKLEIRHAVAVSELRKKLPEEAFRIKNYSSHEVECQDLLFCLYEVEILNQNEPKVVLLIDSLKEKKLALVKYLNDQGAFILLASSAFVEEKNAGLDRPPHLQALFLISSPESRSTTGAEVLSAEFVQETSSESPVNTISSPESLPGMEKKARLLRPKKDEWMETRRPVTRRSAQRHLDETTLEAQKEEGNKNDPEKAAAADASGNKKGCDSHALNLLADLALSSCNSPLISNSSQSSLADSPLHECHNPQRGEALTDSLDEESLEGGSLSGRACQHLLSSGEVGLTPELPSSSQEESYARKKANAKSGSPKSRTLGDTSDSSIQSLISSEHSYASLSSSKRRVLSYPSSKNGVKYMKYEPLPGKVLPFRHQQNICHQHKKMMDRVHFSRSAIMAARLKEDFSKYHDVTFRDKSVKVTFQWEPHYHFGLDSKYTNNSLEKTIVRAVHGPWDASQSNDIEEMKLILHMWVALFYSKPFKYPTVRKVVEHNNPAKYISLNSVIDPMELIDDLEGACSLKRCPADSLSEANPRRPRRVQERAVSSTVKPLSCNELSSTNHIEDELPPANPTKPHSLPSEKQTNARTSKDTVSPLNKVTDVEPGGELRLNRITPLESPHGNLSREASNGGVRPRELGAGAKAELGKVVGSGEVSQSDFAPTNAKPPENSGAKQNSEASAESQEISNATPAKEKGSQPTGGTGLLHPSEEAWQEEDGPPRKKAVESQNLPVDEEEGGEESMEWESIDLALSDSNDTDEESRDVDLDQEGDELLEGSGVKEEKESGIMHSMASPADSLFTSVTSSVSELLQAKNDLATQRELEKRQDPLISVRNPLFPNPHDVVDISCDSMADAVSPGASPALQTDRGDIVELPGDQEASTEPTKHHIFLNRMDLIEDISQDSSPLQPSEECQVQSSMSAPRETTGKQGDSILLVQNPAPGSFVPQEEEGTHLAHTAQLPGNHGHQTSGEVIELVRNQGDLSTSARISVLPEPMSLAKDSCISQEKEAHRLAEMNPVKILQSEAIFEEQKTRQTELLNDSQTEKEFQSLKAGSQEFKDERCCVKDDNLGTPSPIQEVTPEDTMKQKTVAVSEDIKSILYELIDTVSAMNVESGEACPQETSGSNWISSVALECVTPPDSDEESTIADQLAHTDQNGKVAEDLEQQNILAPQERAISQGQELYHSVLHENRCGQMFERETLQKSEPASTALGVLPSSSGTDWSVTRTTRPLCKSPMVETSTPKEDVPSASILCENEISQVSHEASMSEGEDQFSKTHVEIPSCVPAEHQTEYLLKESDPPVDGDTRGDLAGSEDVQPGGARQSLEESENALHEVRTECLGSPESVLDGEKVQLPSRVSSMNKNVEDDSFAMDEDQEHVGSYHSNKAGGSCYSSGPEMAVASDVLDLSPIRPRSDWMYQKNTERSSALEPDTMEHGWPHVSKKADRTLSTNSESVPPKKFVNFSVTKKHKEKTRAFHSSKRPENFMGELGLTNSLSRTWRTWRDPVQNTLDMECLRFYDKVKQVLRKPQPPTSADSLSPPVAAETLLRKVPGTPPLNPPPRSRSPLLITIVNPGAGYGSPPWFPRRSQHRDTFEPPPLTSSHDFLSKAARFKGQRQGSVAPFHLNKLNYRNKLKDSRGDISVIMDEFAEFSRVMTQDSRPTSSEGQEPRSTSEDAPEKRGTPLPPRTVSYQHLFAELCNTVHFRLKNVAQEACKKTYAFYLMETEDGPFFGRAKNLLKKGGHIEMDPLLFCKANHMETERLMVIIRNEDIFQHIHKIPCLLRLKRFPSVTFVGIDRPEDLLDQTYQELFHSGGFVVSDDKVLETMTIGDLKEMVKTLEKLNGYGRWRWLLHYKEIKKLREAAREDPAALAKESLLKSYQGANITEALHYHQCDKAGPRAEHLSCLLNLQVQHNSQRFAVFLTEKSGAGQEALENKGILVLDVNTFIAVAEEMAAPFRSSSYW
nr:PREDICTED: protein FAM208B [Anolis carolinensis]|eukprot:XP_016849038.1 PREDICTED: protein FAM208B [Anolis carolinensis]